MRMVDKDDAIIAFRYTLDKIIKVNLICQLIGRNIMVLKTI